MGRALMIIVVGFTIIFSGIIFNVSSTQQFISSDMNDMHEKWIANNNIESINNVIQSKIFQGTDAVADTFYLDGAKGYFDMAFVAVDSVNEAERFLVTTFSEFKDRKDTTYTIFMLPAYSYYQYFVNNWGGSITHATGDTTRGPMHVNDQIQISGSPVYLSKVSSTDGAGFSATTAVPRGGTEFGINPILAPDVAPLDNEINLLGITFNATTWIEFFNNGDFRHRPDTTMVWTIEPLTTYSGLIRSSGTNDLHVSGTVNGRVTVLSGNDLFIEGDLVYASDPLVTPTSDDYIGLVAKNDIIVNYPPAVPSITIYGVFLALADLRIVRDLGSDPLYLDIVGSLIANRDHFVKADISPAPPGTFNKTHVPDPRLGTNKEFGLNTPPYFPRVQNRLEVIYRSN